MTSHIPKIEVLSGRKRRRRWSTAEKLAIVQETYEPDVTVSIVARRHAFNRTSYSPGANLRRRVR
jgi:transposase